MSKNIIRKIIHIDMDCFYAAVEAREDPTLKSKPLAVGGANKRGVLCTCNYIARKFGLHAAMPTSRALQLCPDLVVVAPNMHLYKVVAREIQAIFFQFTDLVEPLSLDEAFLDVTNCKQCKGSATLIAKEIKRRISATQKLTASAGVGPNKFLAKIASDWNKPNGVFVITPEQVDTFMPKLPVNKIFGVGKVTATKLNNNGITTCLDLQKLSLVELKQLCGGTWGMRLYDLCRGIDERPVEPNRIRKSLSVERTFFNDISELDDCINKLPELLSELQKRLQNVDRPIKNQFIKIKFHDFTHTTVEAAATELSLDIFISLFHKGYLRQQKPVRLLGLGVRFCEPKPSQCQQESLEF